MSVFHDQYKFLEAGDATARTYDNEVLALDLIQEETEELMNEDWVYNAKPDLAINAIKEALDVMYVTAQFLNVTIGPDKALECWEALQANNMSKCVEGKLRKREDGKIMKPEDYEPLDLTTLLLKD